MTQMGGHAIYYNISDSPLGKKESISDTAKVHVAYMCNPEGIEHRVEGVQISTRQKHQHGIFTFCSCV